MTRKLVLHHKPTGLRLYEDAHAGFDTVYSIDGAAAELPAHLNFDRFDPVSSFNAFDRILAWTRKHQSVEG